MGIRRAEYHTYQKRNSTDVVEIQGSHSSINASLCLLPSLNVSGSKLLQPSMTTVRADILFVRSQSTEVITETYTSKGGRKETPCSRRITLTTSHGWWSDGSGISGHDTERSKEPDTAAGDGLYSMGSVQNSPFRFITCNLPSSLTGPGVTVPEQRRQLRDRPLTNQVQAIAVTMHGGACHWGNNLFNNVTGEVRLHCHEAVAPEDHS